MALQHTPDAAIIWLELPDGTKTAFSFGEYLVYRDKALSSAVPESDWEEFIGWLRHRTTNENKVAIWNDIVKFRKGNSDNHAIKAFTDYAIKNEIPI